MEREMMSPFVKPDKYDTKLYSDKLVEFSKSNKDRMEIVKKQLLNIDPCYEYDMVHWHLLEDKKENKKEIVEEEQAPLLPSKVSANVFFAKASIFDEASYDSPIDRDVHEKMNATYCQLCLDDCNNRTHLKRERKIRGKPRIPYDNIPIPTVKPREPSPEPEKNEILYKVIVKTGRDNSCGTTLPVFLTLFGKTGRIRKRQLTKKQGSVAFHFRPGVSEIFYIKGPDVDELEHIGVELVSEDSDGPTESDSWFLEDICVTNLSSKDQESYKFQCDDWFSKVYSDKKVKRKLSGEKEKITHKVFKVTTFTADKQMASLDAAVYISFYGSKRTTQKFGLKNDERKSFQRGSKDEFSVETINFGKLKGIRIGHDGGYSNYIRKKKQKERAVQDGDTEAVDSVEDTFKPDEHFCDWLLDRVVLKDQDTRKQFEFPVNQWVGKNFGKEDYIDLWLPKTIQKPKPIKKQKEDTYYSIKVMTGKKNFAGTDSTIYVELKGSSGKTKSLKFEDTSKEFFEKGKTDSFNIESLNVGKMKELRIWHDNKGTAPGWFCEKGKNY